MSRQLTDYEQYQFGYQDKPKSKLRLTPKGEFIVRMQCWLKDYASDKDAKVIAVELAERLWAEDGKLRRDL